MNTLSFLNKLSSFRGIRIIVNDNAVRKEMKKHPLFHMLSFHKSKRKKYHSIIEYKPSAYMLTDMRAIVCHPSIKRQIEETIQASEGESVSGHYML